MNLSQDYDRKLFADGRALCNLSSTAEIRAWFADQGRPLDDADNAYAAAFGCLQAVAHELLCTVARDRERPMPDEWMHETARGLADYRPTDA